MQLETNIMLQAQDQALKEKLALINENKIKLILKYFVEPYQKKLPEKVLIAWLALLPIDLKVNLNTGVYLFLKNELLALQQTLKYEVLLDYIFAELSGSANLTIFLNSLTVENAILAERLVQYSLLRNRDIGRLFVLLTKRFKSPKIIEIAREVVARLMLRPKPQSVNDLFTRFAIPVVLVDMAQNINFLEGEKFIKEILQYSQVLIPGSITVESANWLIGNICKNSYYEHMCLLHELFRKCMTSENAIAYAKHMEGYIQQYKNG
jgi:hypothetical protein